MCFFPSCQLCFEIAGGHLVQLPAGLSPELDTAAQNAQLFDSPLLGIPGLCSEQAVLPAPQQMGAG